MPVGQKNHIPLSEFLAAQRCKDPGVTGGLVWRALAQRVHLERERRGLSALEMARRVGVRPAFFLAFENGERAPSIELLQRIATALQRRLRIELDPPPEAGS